MREPFLRDDYSEEAILKGKGEPETCRFRDRPGVYGSVMCHHSDFKGYICIENWCLSFIRKDLLPNYKKRIG